MSSLERTKYPRQWVFGLLSFFAPIFSKQNHKLIVLTSFHGDGYRGNTKEIFEELVKHKSLKSVWLSRNKTVINSIQEKYGRRYASELHSFRGLSTLSSAKAIFLTHGTSDYPFMYLPRRASVIQSYHGLPTKRGEYMRPHSDKNPNLLHRIILKDRFSPIDYFLTSSEKVTEIFSKRFNIKTNRFIEIGYPMYDKLKRGTHSNSSDIASSLGIKFGSRKIILYAPTFRKIKRTKWFPFEDFSAKNICDFLENKNALLLLRPHPNEGLNRKRYESIGPRVIVCDHNMIEETTELLKNVHCILTDYSGIYLEGLLLDIPPIFIPYDIESYERGLPLPYNEITPGPKVRTQKELLRAMDKALNQPHLHRTERTRVRNIYFNDCEGSATRKVIQFLESL